MAKFGEFYHVLHHAEEVRESAKEKLSKGDFGGVSEYVGQVAAFLVAADERVSEMATWEKLRAIRQGCEFEEMETSVLSKGKRVRVSSSVKGEVFLEDLINALTKEMLFLMALLLEGLPLPGES